MTKLPHRRIEPLEPPSDSFDRVMRNARARRRRRAVMVATSTTGIALVAVVSFALGSSINATQRVNPAASQQRSDNPTGVPSMQPSPKPAVSHHRPKPSHKTQPPSSSHTSVSPISWLRGRAVDSDGHGIAGLYVMPGAANHVTFISNGRAPVVTDAHGDFKIPCPRAPVLLATWRIDLDVPANTTGGTWAATFVEGDRGGDQPVVPSCSSAKHTTTLMPGATLRGTVHVTDECPVGTTFPVWVALDGDRTKTVRLTGLHDGDAFTFAGLPEGKHSLGGRTNRVGAELPLAPGTNAEQDATFACSDGDPGPSGGPTSSPSPTDTEPSPPITPSPTPDPTITPAG